MHYDIVKKIIEIDGVKYKTYVCTRCNKELCAAGYDNPRSPRFYKFMCPQCKITMMSTSNSIRQEVQE